MLHSDTLAQEFNEILNGVEIFAPFQPLDPAVTFYAPLRTTVRDLRLNPDDFQRNSNAWYKDGSGIYRNVGINRARFEESQLFMESAQTNKCQGYNANPDDAFTNLTKTGDAAAVLSRVYDPAALAAAGLSDICPSGFVLRLDNSAGATTAHVNDTGVFGNTNTHTISAWCRKIAGGNVTSLRNSGNNFITDFENADFERIVAIGEPGGVNQNLRIACQAGTVADFVLQQMEESPAVSSPIVTEGTAGQRAVDRLEWAAPNAFNAPQGMCLFNWVPRWSGSDYLSGLRRDTTLVTLRDTTPGLSGLCRLTHFTNDTISLETNDGVSTVGLSIDAPDLVAHQLYNVAVRWNETQGQKQIGIRLASGWDWSAPAGYAGSYVDDDIIRVCDDPLYGQEMSNLEFWSEDRGTAWIEANYP